MEKKINCGRNQVSGCLRMGHGRGVLQWGTRKLLGLMEMFVVLIMGVILCQN